MIFDVLIPLWLFSGILAFMFAVIFDKPAKTAIGIALIWPVWISVFLVKAIIAAIEDMAA